MKAILENLNRCVGVIGSAVVTDDGMMVTSAMTDRRDQDALAAFGTSLVLSAQRSLKEFGGSDLNVMTVDGSRGKIVIVGAANAYLLVITDSNISLDATMLDIKGAVRKLQKMISLDA